MQVDAVLQPLAAQRNHGIACSDTPALGLEDGEDADQSLGIIPSRLRLGKLGQGQLNADKAFLLGQ